MESKFFLLSNRRNERNFIHRLSLLFHLHYINYVSICSNHQFTKIFHSRQFLFLFIIDPNFFFFFSKIVETKETFENTGIITNNLISICTIDLRVKLNEIHKWHDGRSF